MTDPVVDQPPPVPTEEVPVWDLVIADMHARDQIGRERYGTPLQVENGRSHVIDAYQEGLDGLAYLRAEIERQNRALPPKSLRMRAAIEQTHKWLHSDDHPVDLCSDAPCSWLMEATE